MDLSPHARRWYQVVITTNPETSATWEASFDDGATWWPGESIPTVTNGWRWLIAGEKADATGTVAVIHTPMRPDLRVIDAPEIEAFRQTVPLINYRGA